MDPIANLREQRQLAAQLVEPVDVDSLKAECHYSEDGGFDGAGNDLGSVDALIEYKNAVEDRLRSLAIDAARLGELVEALDGWRRSGGFDPYLPAENGKLPSHAQMLALGRIMRANGWQGARVQLGSFGLPGDYLHAIGTHRPGSGAGGLVECGIDPAGDVST